MVVDVGSESLKIGYSGFDEPEYVFPNAICYTKYSGKTGEWTQADPITYLLPFFLGDEAIKMSHPKLMPLSTIQSTEELENMLDLILKDKMRIDSSGNRFLLTE